MKNMFEGEQKTSENGDKPTIAQLKEIINENNVDLFEAQIIFASRLADYHNYDGPDKENIISTVEYRQKEKEWSKKVADRKRELRDEGKEMREILKTLKQEGLWRE